MIRDLILLLIRHTLYHVISLMFQGSCGSCWTFSTTGAMETHMAIEFGGAYNLSEQQLVDCAQAFNNHGCSG